MLPEVVKRNSNNPNAEAEAEAVMAKFQNSLELGQQGRIPQTQSKALKEVLEDSRKLLGENNPLVAMVSVELVNAYMNQKQFSRARTLLEEVEPITGATLGDFHPRVAQNAVRLASLLSILGDHQGAQQLESAILIAEASFGPDDPRTTMLRVELVPTLIQLGQLDIAESELNDLVERLTKDYDGPDGVLARARVSLGSLAAERDQEDKAAEHFEAAVEEYTKFGEVLWLSWTSSLYAGIHVDPHWRVERSRRIAEPGN